MRSWGAATAGALLVALASGCDGGTSSLSAEDQVPALATGLARVDNALAAHEFASARTDLRKLRAAVVRARNADELRASDATRVLDAISQLLATIPAGSSGSTTAPVPTTSAPTPSSRPTHRQPTPTDSVSASPSASDPTPSASPTTSTPSPTASATGEATPTAAAASPTP